MPVQGTIVLDSGAFLTNEEVEERVEVGYFRPILRIYNDNMMVKEIKLRKPKNKGMFIDICHLSAKGEEIGGGIHLSDCLPKFLLRINDLYVTASDQMARSEKRVKDCCKSDFDYIFRFNCGYFRSSMVKERWFKEYDLTTRKPTGNTRKHDKPICHDIVASFDLQYNETLKLTKDINGKKSKLWSSKDEPTILTRFDIEIIADNESALDYFLDTVKPIDGQTVWVPNQGEPPPTWRHDGATGTGT
jgi:hypothetical protein